MIFLNSLKINLLPILNPMPEHKYFGNLIWCEMTILVDAGKELFVTLLNMHWEINW